MNNRAHTAGFTLVETLVAIAVMTISLVGPLYLAERSFMSATNARDSTMASYLAQEGIEYARAVRDRNFLVGDAWLTTLSSCVSSLCRVDVPNASVVACSGSCPALNYNSSTRLYNHASTGGSNQPSRFTRTLSLSSISSTEYRMTVTVSWVDRGISRSVVLSEFIHDWF